MSQRFEKLARLAALIILLFAITVPALAKDEWTSVRSKHFFLIGNADEKEIRETAAKLEQFRETFKLLFPRARFEQSIGTNVIVFKDKKAYAPFKPKLADGKPDEGIAGYFQPGEDVNYITLSAEGRSEDRFGTIFHEYVHFLINAHFGKSEVPPWFNEGLAEYYQTFEIEDDRKVFLGKLQEEHLYRLRQSKLIPFNQFFEIDNYSLHKNGSHSRSIFYAQAWALMHYLIQGGQSKNLSVFLSAVLDGDKPESAFRKAFGSGYAEMEKALSEYVRRRTLPIQWVEFDKKLTFENEMTSAPLSAAEADAYLGDLLYHTREYEDASVYLKRSLTADPDNTLANTAYGLVRMKQGSYDEGKRYLERAVASNRSNHFAQYSYAYALSRESMDEFGFVSRIPAETAEKMRTALKASIDANPDFGPSYQLLAFINLVNNEDLDGALEYLRKGMAIQPGNQEYSMLTAKIYLRQEKYDEAEKIAEKVARTTDEEQLRADALDVLKTVSEFRVSLARIKKNAEKSTGSRGEPILLKRSQVTEEDIRRVNRENLVNRLHMELPRVGPSESMVIGRLERIECAGGRPRFFVSTADGPLELVSEDFASLFLLTLDEKVGPLEVGCDADLSAVNTVFTYKKLPAGTGPTGRLLSMTFVPDFFRLKTPEEIANTRPVVIIDDEERPGSTVEFSEMRRESMMEALARSLRKPKDGERRMLGKLRKITCQRNYTLYEFDAAGRRLRLRSDPEVTVHIVTYTPDTAGIEFRCGFGPLETNAVVTFKDSEDKKLDGNLIAVEFVPPGFSLD